MLNLANFYHIQKKFTWRKPLKNLNKICTKIKKILQNCFRNKIKNKYKIFKKFKNF